MKTKTTSKFIMLILSVVMIATLFAVISVPAFAAEGDPCTSTDSCTGTYANGFCSVCNGYEPAALNADGCYEIGSAGQLFWYANYINTVDRTANAVLTADIDLENRPWTPIGVMGEDSNSFRGVFDGKNHTIKGLNVTAASNGAGFFGEVRTGTVKNFTIYGEVVVNAEVDYVGGVIGSICGLNGENDLYRNGAEIQNITSYVNVTAKAHGVGMIGGFVGYADHQSLIEKCSWYGTFDAGSYHVDNGAGGFIGKIQENTSEVTIRNCAAYGTIKTNYEKNSFNDTPTIYMGGFLGLSDTDAHTVLENCLFAGKFERGENLTDQAFLGAFGTLRSVNSIKNCYYLGDGVLEAVHSDSPLKPGSDNVEITSVTKAQLLSGEVAYKLGEYFGQILEGENRQSYPVLGETKVEDSQRFEIYGQQLNIGGDLSMKYYVMGYAPEFNSKALYMEFSHNGVKTKVYAGEPNADGFYVFVLEGINPQCMGDSIRAMLCYNETEVASHGCEDGKEYSVEKNLLNLLEKYKDDAALVALINDTLAYGKAAEEYRGHTSIEGNYAGTDREIPESELSTSPEGDLRVHQVTVRFGTMNHIVLMIESKNGAPTVKVGDKSFDVTLHEENSNYYVSVLHGVSATDFGNDITVAISDGTTTIDYTVSINDYLYAISQSTDASDEMKALAKALYNYGISAHQYVGVHTGGEATCTHGKLCDICGFEYDTTKAPDNHASDNYTCTDNGDGTHTKTHECGVAVGEPEDHTIENHVCTACGAMEIVVSFNAGDFEWKTGDKLYFCRVSGDNEWEEYAFTATVAGDGTVTWTPDRTLYWDGTGEHKLVVIYPDTGYVWDTWYIDEDQSTLENLRKNDHLNSIWSGNPTTDPITFDLKHRLAKVTVNYEAAEGVTVSKAEVYTLTQYLLFDIHTLERKNVAWEEGHDLWINSYHNGNQFTAFVSPDAYAADGNFIKITLSDGSVREVKMNKAVTFEEGAEYTYKVVITADGAYLTCADECTFEYTDNEDGLTHSKVCTECGYVAASENHTLTYSVNEAGDTITASCSANCGHTGTATISATGKTYDGNAVEVVVTKTGSLENTDIPVTLTKDGGAFTGEPVNAGAYTASVTLGDKTMSVDFTIAKAAAGITLAPTPNTLTYIGEAQYLINPGEAVGGTMVYSLTENGEYTTSIPQGTNAGDYTVWYYVLGDANHNDSAKASVSVNIAKATVTVTADAKAKIYGDEDPTLTYTAEGLLGVDTLTSALTGALSREEGENVGSYAITLGTLSADNYTISYEGADFTIQAKEVTDPIVTLDQTSYQYDGNVKEPTVTSVVVDGRTLTEGIDYTVSYEDNVYVNTEAKVVINFMGNYDGTFCKWFTITQDPDTTEFDGEWVAIP